MPHGKEVGSYRKGTVEVVSPHPKDRIAYGTGSEAFPRDWEGSMEFHLKRSIKEQEAHPDRVPKLGGGVGDVLAAKSLISHRSAANAKTLAGDKTRDKDIKS